MFTQVCVSHLSVCIFIVCVCVIFVCRQVQNELSQTTEKLHGEMAQRQQLSEEIEQVAAIIDALFYILVTPETNKLSVDNVVCLCVVNFQAQMTITELEAQLNLLKESPQADTEDVAQLKVR